MTKTALGGQIDPPSASRIALGWCQTASTPGPRERSVQCGNVPSLGDTALTSHIPFSEWRETKRACKPASAASHRAGPLDLVISLLFERTFLSSSHLDRSSPPSLSPQWVPRLQRCRTSSPFRTFKPPSLSTPWGSGWSDTSVADATSWPVGRRYSPSLPPPLSGL